jgi:hypothetical protein
LNGIVVEIARNSTPLGFLRCRQCGNVCLHSYLGLLNMRAHHVHRTSQVLDFGISAYRLTQHTKIAPSHCFGTSLQLTQWRIMRILSSPAFSSFHNQVSGLRQSIISC